MCGRSKNAYVVLGDVVRSRRVEDRDALQTSLADACDAADRAAAGVVAPFSVRKGVDEVGGVLGHLADLYDAVRAFADELYPRRVRFAVARGEIDVGADTGDVARMDGPAFHDAADLLEAVERLGLLLDLDTGRDRLDTAIADEANLLLERRDDWTDHQRHVADRYDALGSQAAVADELDVTQQAVSKTLAAASYDLVTTIEHRLRETLDTAYGPEDA